MIVFFPFLSVLVVSLISLVGVFILFIRADKLKNILLFLVSFSTGALLGDVFFHLLPESVGKNGFNNKLATSILIGLFVFFVLEKFIRWRHCHIPTSAEHPHPLGYMNLVGDAVHNFIDGMVIAASYLFGLPLGLATSLAVIFHEIPQEISDFSVLIYSGFSRQKAIFFNFFSAIFAILGCFFILLLGRLSEDFIFFLVPFTAGGFFYIAGSDLIPELHKEASAKKSVLQLLALLSGLAVMYVLKIISQ